MKQLEEKYDALSSAVDLDMAKLAVLNNKKA
jgi:hypothetical protein